MAFKPKPKPVAVTKRAGWQETPGLFLAGQAHVDEADLTIAAMEKKWGVDRLRLLVPVELREKFDRQRFLFAQAIRYGDLEELKSQARRTVAAYNALDRVATAAGAETRSDGVWEVALDNGTVAAIVRNNEDARHVKANGRFVSIWTLDEIGRLLVAFPEVCKIKHAIPGASVTRARADIQDPLIGFPDVEGGLDDDIPF